MKSLQTRCMFASAAVHCLLLVALVVGSAFVSPQPKEISLVPLHKFFKVTDDETSGGGGSPTPNPEQPSAPPAVQKPVIQAPPAQPVVKPPEPVKPPETKQETKQEPVKPPKVEPIKPPKTETVKPPKVTKAPATKIPDPIKPAIEPKKTVKREIEVDLNQVVKPDVQAERLKAERQRQRAEERKRQEAEDKRRREEADASFRKQVADARLKAEQDARETADNLSKSLDKWASKTSGNTLIEMPDGSGPAFVNYSQLVFAEYYKAWLTPSERSGDVFVRTEIVVSKDGRVVRAQITGKSGDAAVDKSVQQTLDRVRKLPAFPEGATDSQRTFKITFNLKAKRQLG